MNGRTTLDRSLVDLEKSFVTQQQEYIVVLDDKRRQLSPRERRRWRNFVLLTLQGERFEGNRGLLPYIELNRDGEYLFGGMVDRKTRTRKNRRLLLRFWEEGFAENARMIRNLLDPSEEK